MTTLKFSIPNNSSFRDKTLKGVLRALVVATAAIVAQTTVQHMAFFQLHYILWKVLSILALGACIGWAAIFADEALLNEKGQIQLDEDGLEIGDEALLLNMIRKVAVVVNGYRGQVQEGESPASGSHNHFVVYTKQQQTIDCEFLIKSKGELETLEEILTIWKKHGILLVTEGINISL